MSKITVILGDERQERLDKLVALDATNTSTVMRTAIDYLWEMLGDRAEELAQAHAAITRRLEEDK